MGKSILNEKRGLIKQLMSFYSAPTVPTVRIAMKGNLPVLELGKRARIRENSLADSIDRKGWDICSSPIPMIHGKTIEMGYITHPSGCTVDLKPVVRVRASDDQGNPIKLSVPKRNDDGTTALNPDGTTVMIETAGYKYIEAAFEGVIGVQSDLDDFNESSEREQSRGWVVPFLVGSIIGIMFFAPLFAWLMSFVGAHAS